MKIQLEFSQQNNNRTDEKVTVFLRAVEQVFNSFDVHVKTDVREVADMVKECFQMLNCQHQYVYGCGANHIWIHKIDPATSQTLADRWILIREKQ